MVSRIAILVIDAVDPDLIARFWCGVLGWVEIVADPEGNEFCLL